MGSTDEATKPGDAGEGVPDHVEDELTEPVALPVNVSATRAGADRAYLVVLTGTPTGRMQKLAEGETVVGRGHDVDLRILDDGVSRRHARVRLVEKDLVIEDLGSRNGTFVNEERVQTRVLRDGDKIRIGTTTILKFTYRDDLEETYQTRLYEAAVRDALTGAYNRRYLEEHLEAELRFARRHGTRLAVLCVDLDGLKAVNDGHGHQAGDLVLESLGRAVLATLRREDLFARTGGDEFVVLCRDIPLHAAGILGERIRRAVERLDVRLPDGTRLPATVSIGVASYPEVDATEPWALVKAADEILYRSKREGRNRVCLHR